MIKSDRSRVLFLLCYVLISGCAGSAPDYQARTVGGPGQEAKLVGLFDRLEPVSQNEKSRNIIVPLCSSTVAKPETGWAIDGGDWCVVPCNRPAVQARWVIGSDGSRCLSASATTTTTQVEVDFNAADLSLQQSGLFKGLSNSFLSDTEWHCKEYDYLIDPDTRLGFWNELESGRVVYRFHRDGKLLTGRAPGLMNLSGSWRVSADGQVLFNSSEVFKYAIDYGGGRFDNFSSATNKQVCRYVREAGL